MAIALAGAPAAAAPQAAAVFQPPVPGTLEILAHDAAGHPTLARVALGHGLPCGLETGLRMGGTWCYLLADGDGVLVCDAGPRYPLGWCLLPWAAPKALVPTLPGVASILAALDTAFPGRGPTQIVLNHWHPDHTEAAPALQQALHARFGVTPPLRIRAADRPAHGDGILAGGAEAVFRAAGYRRGDWQWGPDLRNGEALGQSGYAVLALPGHTRGTIALVNARDRIAIGPSSRYEEGAGWWTEAPRAFRASRLAFYQATYGYRHYAAHPGSELFDNWPAPPWGRMEKQ